MKTSELSLAFTVDRLLPQHIVENNELFVMFLKEYYNWSEKEGNVNNIAHVLGMLHQLPFEKIVSQDYNVVDPGSNNDDSPADGGAGSGSGSGGAGSGSGSGGGTTPPDNGGTTPPDNGGTTPPTPPDNGTVTPPSLTWYEDTIFPAELGDSIRNALRGSVVIANIRSGSNVPVGAISSYTFIATNTEAWDNEILNYQLLLRGEGIVRIYHNGVLHWEYPGERRVDVQVSFDSYYEPEWTTGTKLVSDRNPSTISLEEIEDSILYGDVPGPYDPNTWTIHVDDVVLGGLPIGLRQGANTIKIEFIPTLAGSILRALPVAFSAGYY